VALMGRKHLVAVAMSTITRDMIVVIQGLVIQFSGALPQLGRP